MREEYSLDDYTCYMRAKMVGLVVAGIIIWIVVAIFGLLFGANSKFIWTCLTGALLGIVGIFITNLKARKGGV